MSLNDEEWIGAEELAADGSDAIFAGATVVSTTSGTKTIVLSGVDLFRPPEELEENDKVILTGTSGGLADGTYTVDSITAIATLVVKEAIADSTGGSCDARHPSGAAKVGLDPTGMGNVTATDVQGAMEELDGAISTSGLTEPQHEALDETLVHEMVRDVWGTILYGLGDARPTSHTMYRNLGKTTKDREVTITYNGPGGRPDTVVIEQFDTSGNSITGQTLTVSLSYNADLLPDDYTVVKS